MTVPKDARPTAARRGYDLAWIKVRAAYLRKHPICEVPHCAARAVHVDHVLTVRVAPHLRLDPKNLRALCPMHHNQRSGLQAHGIDTDQPACDATGQPLDPSHPWAGRR
jgi:5-methylcytosine-specific restriction endonuclease McrA